MWSLAILLEEAEGAIKLTVQRWHLEALKLRWRFACIILFSTTKGPFCTIVYFVSDILAQRGVCIA